MPQQITLMSPGFLQWKLHYKVQNTVVRETDINMKIPWYIIVTQKHSQWLHFICGKYREQISREWVNQENQDSLNWQNFKLGLEDQEEEL